MKRQKDPAAGDAPPGGRPRSRGRHEAASLGIGCHFSEAIEVQQADRRGPAPRRATGCPALSVFNRVVA